MCSLSLLIGKLYLVVSFLGLKITTMSIAVRIIPPSGDVLPCLIWGCLVYLCVMVAVVVGKRTSLLNAVRDPCCGDLLLRLLRALG